MKKKPLLLQRLLVAPEIVRSLSLQDWDIVVRQARAAHVLSRLAFLLERTDLINDVPTRPRAHLLSALVLGKQQGFSVSYEIAEISRALSRTGVPVLLLKGGAYFLKQLDAANGRLFNDIDILVPKSRLGDVEASLIFHGWQTGKLDKYDQYYYRRWMHELPPMCHMERGTILDVHHTILPPTTGRSLNADLLFSNAVDVRGYPGLKVLAPTDMVLHSMTHLFYDGELERGFRDLVDLDSLLRQFGQESPSFWERLVPRARQLDLLRPLYYGLRYAHTLFGTPIPDAVITESAEGGPASPIREFMDELFQRALSPPHSTCSDTLTPLARWLLYVRSHNLRMPAHLLAFHLTYKAFVRLRSQPESPVEA